MAKSTTPIAFRVETTVYNRLRKLAKKKKIKLSDLIREMIADHAHMHPCA
jgi:macrodomain Ter protein organizer (MatP/YcbG family)